MSDSMTPWTVAHQAPLFMEFPRQEYWSRLPFPPPGDRPNPGIEHRSPAMAGEFFTIEPSGNPEAKNSYQMLKIPNTISFRGIKPIFLYH